MADLLNGVPSIVVGIFAYAVIVLAGEALFHVGRSVSSLRDADPGGGP